KQSLAMIEERLGTNPSAHENSRSARMELGKLYFAMGDSAKVASILKPALIAAIDNRGLPWRSRFEALLSLAELEERDGSYEMAENLARKACSLTEQLPGISQTAIV